MIDPVTQLIAIAQDIRISRVLSLSATVVLTYDAILTIPDELEYIWFCKWSSGKTLYFAGRYPVLAWFFFIEICGPFRIKYSVIHMIADQMRHGATMVTFCEVMLSLRKWWWPYWLCTLPPQIILALRTLAIWDRDWRATIILGIGAATFNISVLISASLLEKLEWLPYVAQPVSRFETLLHCYIGVTGPPAAITKLGFASLMFYDSVVFILILIRTVHEGCKTRARILTILLRDGMIYYAVLFALSVGNLIIATSLPQFKIALIASLAPALIAAGSIGASHIILNLRKHSYARHTLGLGQLSTMQYAERHMILDDTDVAVIERDQ